MFPTVLQRAFKIIAFDWDGTAVPDRNADATEAIEVIDGLLRAGVYVVPVTGTNIKNMWGQCLAHINGPHKARLFACTNRGSEVFGFDTESGDPVVRQARHASQVEEETLTRIAERVKSWLETDHGLDIDIIYDRVNRRKIDIIHKPEWADPPKARITELEAATAGLLSDSGYTKGVGGLIDEVRRISIEEGLSEPSLTTDMKYIEVGLTDKGHSMRWILGELAAPGGITTAEILIGGDEFGPLGGALGSDYLMAIPEMEGATFVSVGNEPNGVTPPVLNLGGGPARFIELLRDQLNRATTEERA